MMDARPCGDAECRLGRERKMVTVAPGVFCDPCIAPIIAALNSAGLATKASCCGHGYRPGRISLRDGRELFLFGSFDEAQEIDRLFPIDINGHPTRT